MKNTKSVSLLVLLSLFMVITSLSIPVKVDSLNQLDSLKFGKPFYFIVQNSNLEPPSSFLPKNFKFTMPQETSTDFKLFRFIASTTLVYICLLSLNYIYSKFISRKEVSVYNRKNISISWILGLVSIMYLILPVIFKLDTFPLKGAPIANIYNIFFIVIYISLVSIFIFNLLFNTSSQKIIFILIITLLFLNINFMYNYGIYIDEHNTSPTYHIGFLGWINIILILMIFIQSSILVITPNNQS